jgi:hypothetical protein
MDDLILQLAAADHQHVLLEGVLAWNQAVERAQMTSNYR